MLLLGSTVQGVFEKRLIKMKQDFNLSINKSKLFFLSFAENASIGRFGK